MGFAIATGTVVMAFITSKTYTQLAVASLLYLPLVVMVFKLFPHKSKNTALAEKEIADIQNPPTHDLNWSTTTDKAPVQVGIVDVDKRAFLEMIGVAGLSYFVFSLFTKKAESLFLGGSVKPAATVLKDSVGNAVDPSKAQPTDGYQISDIDNGDHTYYGFTNSDGGWFIMNENPVNGAFRYIKGTENFQKAWKNREYLEYDYYHNAFGQD